MRGFTLLELLMVLLILSLLTALTAPRLLQMYSSAEAALVREDVFSQLNSLGFYAYQQGFTFELKVFPVVGDVAVVSPLPANFPLKLPAGWQLYADVPLRYWANGVCSGGKAELRAPDVVYLLDFPPPFCQVVMLKGVKKSS